MVESRREGNEQIAIAHHFFLTSLPCDAALCAKAVREHGGIEHVPHWVLDVSVREDAGRIRRGDGAHTMAVLRHSALHLLRRETDHTRGITARRQRAGWDRGTLLQV